MKKLLVMSILLFAVGAYAQYPSGKLFNLEVINQLISEYTESDVLETDTLNIPNGSVINLGDMELSSRNNGDILFFRSAQTTPNFNFLSEWGSMVLSFGRIHEDSVSSYSAYTKWWFAEMGESYVGFASGEPGDFTLAVLFDSSGTVDFPEGITSGTIEADNGWTGTWVNAESDTVHVVGGIITDVVSP